MKVFGSFFFFLTLSAAAPLDDIVEYLPDYGIPPTPQFSGYLNATAGCDSHTNGQCMIHYWLALAESDNPTKKPVVLWLNGGPGSTSILGFLQENGPLLINANGGLMENPFSWTKVANLLVLESPVGVGYSYCDRQRLGKTCKNTDKFTASASRAALQHFFEKFPEFLASDFFITGESYAGIYIPTLSKEILDNAPEINLKGVAVGDPCTDNTAQRDSMDALWYGYKYGLVDEEIYDLLWNSCDARAPNLMTKGGKHLVASLLNQRVQQSGLTGRDLRKYSIDLLKNLGAYGGPRFRDTPECQLAFRKFMMSSSHGLSQSWKDLYIDDYSLFAPVTSQQDDDMATYMSRKDVREALHVQSAPTSTWPSPKIGFDYTSEYDACNDDAPEGSLSMIDFYKDIVPRLDIVWIYNGDTDPCLSYEGTRMAVKRMGFAELDGGSYRPWFYNQTGTTLDVIAEKAPLFGPDFLVQPMGAQFGGEVVNYEQGLSFVTFHGSGHMVPQFRPQAALHMLTRLLQRQSLSPLLPSNKTLAEMDDVKFKMTMEEWTETAMSQPFVSDVVFEDDDTVKTA